MKIYSLVDMKDWKIKCFFDQIGVNMYSKVKGAKKQVNFAMIFEFWSNDFFFTHFGIFLIYYEKYY